MDLGRLVRRLREESTDPFEGGFDLRRASFLFKRRLFNSRLDLTHVTVEDLGLSPEIANRYDHSGGPDLELVLNELRFGRRDAILDVGAGKGGALLTFYKYSPRRLAGVELSQELVDIARGNFRSFHVRGIEYFCGDAAEFEEYGSFNYLYMFNPFPAPTMRRVMAVLDDALRVHEYEKVTLIYRNPVCHEEVVASGSFSLVKTYVHSWNPINVYSARIHP